MIRTALITGATGPQDANLSDFLLRNGPLYLTIRIAGLRFKVPMTELILQNFKQWPELPMTDTLIVNPQESEFRIKPYTQTLPRSNINNQRVLVVLAISYRVNQSNSTELP